MFKNTIPALNISEIIHRKINSNLYTQIYKLLSSAVCSSHDAELRKKEIAR